MEAGKGGVCRFDLASLGLSCFLLFFLFLSFRTLYLVFFFSGLFRQTSSDRTLNPPPRNMVFPFFSFFFFFPQLAVDYLDIKLDFDAV